MIQMCEFRDPEETGPHANRVGAYSAEIYVGPQSGLPPMRSTNQDLMRIAAMLHDSASRHLRPDPEKTRRAGYEEFNIMKFHTIYGARLFQNSASDLDVMAAEIALNHHEKWDGGGYPGHIDDIFGPRQPGPGQAGGRDSPGGPHRRPGGRLRRPGLQAKLQGASAEERTLKIIREESGRQFDPEVVQAFLEVHDTIAAIKEKYQENPTCCSWVPRLMP